MLKEREERDRMFEEEQKDLQMIMEQLAEQKKKKQQERDAIPSESEYETKLLNIDEELTTTENQISELQTKCSELRKKKEVTTTEKDQSKRARELIDAEIDQMDTL
jgi:hypothetical protein